MQRNRRQRHECRLIVADRVGNSGAEVASHGDEIRVTSVRDDAVTGAVFRHARPRFDDTAYVAIAEWNRLIELAAHRVERREHAVGAHLVQYLPCSVRLAAYLFDPIRAAELQQHALGTG